MFLEECIQVVKEKKIAEYITDDRNIFSDEESSDYSGEENCNEQNYNGESSLE